jgi:hypothetical protein
MKRFSVDEDGSLFNRMEDKSVEKDWSVKRGGGVADKSNTHDGSVSTQGRNTRK